MSGLDPNTGNDPALVMNSLPLNRAQRQLADIARAVALRDKVYAQMLALTDGLPIAEIDFSAGDGRQKSKYIEIEALEKSYDRMTKRIEWLERNLYGRGAVTINSRRK